MPDFHQGEYLSLRQRDMVFYKSQCYQIFSLLLSEVERAVLKLATCT